MIAQLLSINNFAVGVLLILAFVFAMAISISLHEYLHAYVAYKNGDITAKISGRMTLNPFAHLDPIGILMLLFFGFGWAKPVPVNKYNFVNGKASEFQVAIAGICGNLVLGVFCSIVYVLCEKFIPGFATGSSLILTFLNLIIYYTMAINFVLAFFNMIPIYPLDGFRVVETYAKPNNKYVNFMQRYSLIVFVILIISNVVDLYITHTAGLAQTQLMNLWYWLLSLLGV